MLKEVKKDAETRMAKAVKVLQEDLQTVRSGRATPTLIERLSVDYYGVPTPLQGLATIVAPEPHLLMVKPFDPSSIKLIEKAILKSDVGLTPNNDGKVIRLNVPPLTEERRHQLIKIVHKRLEEARVAVRNIRRDAVHDLRDMEKESMITEDDLKWGTDDVQELTDKYIDKINEIGKAKEAEIMEI